jgi:hypothetical protein
MICSLFSPTYFPVLVVFPLFQADGWKIKAGRSAEFSDVGE